MNTLRTLTLALGVAIASAAAMPTQAAPAQAAPANAPASAAPTTESIDKLLLAMHADRQIDIVHSQVDAVMKNAIDQITRGEKLTAEQQKIIDDYRAKSVAIVQAELNMKKLRPIYETVYTRNFSQQEIDGLTTFFQSPVGQAYVNKVPAVMQDVMGQVQATLTPMMEKLKAAAIDTNNKVNALRAQKK